MAAPRSRPGVNERRRDKDELEALKQRMAAQEQNLALLQKALANRTPGAKPG